MTWIIKVPNGPDISSDDFTLDQLDSIEKESDTYWSIANVYRSAKVARAFMRQALILAGRDPAEADTLTMKTYKTAFDYEPDEPVPGDSSPTKARRKAGQTRKSSSSGAPTDSNGLQLLPGNSESVTSSAS